MKKFNFSFCLVFTQVARSERITQKKRYFGLFFRENQNIQNYWKPKLDSINHYIFIIRYFNKNQTLQAPITSKQPKKKKLFIYYSKNYCFIFKIKKI